MRDYRLLLLAALDIYLGTFAFEPHSLLRIQQRASPFAALVAGRNLLNTLLKVALLVGTWVSNPWTVAPLGAGTLLGCSVLGVSPASLVAVDWSLSGPAFYGSLATGLRPLVLPFVVGNLALGALAAATVFLLLRTLLARRRPSP